MGQKLQHYSLNYLSCWLVRYAKFNDITTKKGHIYGPLLLVFSYPLTPHKLHSLNTKPLAHGFSSQIKFFAFQSHRELAPNCYYNTHLCICRLCCVRCCNAHGVRAAATLVCHFSFALSDCSSLALHRQPSHHWDSGVWARSYPQSWGITLGCCLCSSTAFLSHILSTFFPWSSFLAQCLSIQKAIKYE